MNILRILLLLILAYYVLLHAIYLLLVLIGSFQLRRYHRGITYSEFRRIAESSLTTPVSLIIPAHNEEGIIVDAVKGALNLNYPRHEVIVVDDGSTDGTVARLIENFGLHPVEKQGRKSIVTRDVLRIHESHEYPNLVVIEKTNGRRADAINAGVTFSRYPLLCIIDADCYLDRDALLHMARPFLSDSSVAAVAGVVRPSNGLTVSDGKIVAHGLPNTLLGLNQEVEYARSFQWSRIGLCRLKSMLCISGALLLIRKNLFEEVGGSWPGAITDDFELTVRLNRHLFDRRKEDRRKLVFAPDAVCYTEIPEGFVQYADQRNRWQRGTLQALLRNASMLFNPRYGITGLFGMPFYLFFEAFSAIVELSAWILMAVMLVTGMAGASEVLVMLFLAYILGVFLSLSAVLLTESTRLRTASWGEFWKVIAAILTDNLGFHQFHLLTRIVGTFQYFLFGRLDLGAPMERRKNAAHIVA